MDQTIFLAQIRSLDLVRMQQYFCLLQKLTVLVGDPVDLGGLVMQQQALRTSAVVMRKQITDTLQEKLRELRACAEALHSSWNTDSLVDFRTL